jgi:hypothetical protein
MKLVSFHKFETATKILESHSPESASDQMLTENEITREELAAINEGILGDIFGGMLKGLKEKILKAVPGSLMKKADAILKEYRDTKMSIADKIMKERNKIYKSNLTGADKEADETDKKRSLELKDRAGKAIQQIELASKSKLDAIENKLKMLTKDKSETLNNYVKFELAQIQEDAANKQLEDAEKFSDETVLADIEKEVEAAKNAKIEAKKALEAQKEEKKKKEDAENEENKKKEDALKNNPANAKKGQTWLTDKENEVEIISTKENDKGEELAAGYVYIKGKSGNKQAIPSKNLKTLVKDIDTELKKVA